MIWLSTCNCGLTSLLIYVSSTPVCLLRLRAFVPYAPQSLRPLITYLACLVARFTYAHSNVMQFPIKDNFKCSKRKFRRRRSTWSLTKTKALINIYLKPVFEVKFIIPIHFKQFHFFSELIISMDICPLLLQISLLSIYFQFGLKIVQIEKARWLINSNAPKKSSLKIWEKM